jgi:hypothetical protein
MNQTLSNKERLKALEVEIAKQEPLAEAERAFSTASPEVPNPWEGAGEKLNALRTEQVDLLLEERGRNLKALLEKKQELEARLNRLQVQRQVCDRVVAERAAHETVVRYLNAPRLMMREITPWGHSFEIFRQWYESKKPLYNAAPECAPFFLHSQEAKDAGLCFNLEGDRAAVHLWIEAVDAANKTMTEWDSTASMLRDLVREHPELQAAS